MDLLELLQVMHSLQLFFLYLVYFYFIISHITPQMITDSKYIPLNIRPYFIKLLNHANLSSKLFMTIFFIFIINIFIDF